MGKQSKKPKKPKPIPSWQKHENATAARDAIRWALDGKIISSRRDRLRPASQWEEVQNIHADQAAFNSLAESLLCNPVFIPRDHERDFLEKIAQWKWRLTPRQAGWLLDLRDAAKAHQTIDGLNVLILIRKCFEARFAPRLSQANIDFIEGLQASGRDYVTGRELAHFKLVCRLLGEMD